MTATYGIDISVPTVDIKLATDVPAVDIGVPGPTGPVGPPGPVGPALPIEYGTWVPSLRFEIPGTSTWNPSPVYCKGYYTKIDRLIIWTFVYVGTHVNGDAAGQIWIEGLPYVSSTEAQSIDIGPGNMGGWTKPGYGSVVTGTLLGTKRMNLLVNGSGIPAAALVVADLPSGTSVALRASGHYMTAPNA